MMTRDELRRHVHFCCAVEIERLSDRQTKVLGKAFQVVTTDLTLP